MSTLEHPSLAAPDESAANSGAADICAASSGAADNCPASNGAADNCPASSGAADNCAASSGADDSAAQNTQPKPQIGGFNPATTRSIFREPSLYLSIAVIFIVSLVSLGANPWVFWISFFAMTLLSVAFHVLAERVIFKSNKNNDGFEVPMEGVFVLTFGTIIPGLALLGYGGYSVVSSLMQTSVRPSTAEDLLKAALLTVVPVFNFIVWSAVRKGYLMRPRLIGLMSGLAVGLSLSWTAIWLKCLLVPTDVSCRFGWMLLLCSSPLLLFASGSMCLELWQKTDPHMRRITSTFSILGGLLSFLFVFTPMVRCFALQSLLTEAKSSSRGEQSRAIEIIRSLATPGELRLAPNTVSGFNLAEMLLPQRGLRENSDADRDLFFRITGKPLVDGISAPTEEDVLARYYLGDKVPELSLASSQMSGSVNAATLSASVDWTMTFHNSGTSGEEAVGEIALPAGAVVSRATLWVNGIPQEGAFAPTEDARRAYQSVVSTKKDPLLMTMPAPDRVMFQCFPVREHDSMKIRIGFKVPLQSNAKECSMQLPSLLNSNFAQPKRHRISMVSADPLRRDMPGMVAESTQRIGSKYVLNGILKVAQPNAPLGKVTVSTQTTFHKCVTPDWFSPRTRFVVSETREVKTLPPKRLFVVVDPSASLSEDAGAITTALAAIPSRLLPKVCFVPEGSYQTRMESDVKLASSTRITSPLKLITADEASSAILPEFFVGGQDNEPALREILETAAEQPCSAVLWIHGAQPLHREAADATPLDLVHKVTLYDLQIHPGAVTTLHTLNKSDVSFKLASLKVDHRSLDEDIKNLVASWEHPAIKLCVDRRIVKQRPDGPIVSDREVSAQLTCLWAKDEVARMIDRGDKSLAADLAGKYRIITPVSGVVVLETRQAYKGFGLDPRHYVDRHQWKGGGLIGAPVDPRYGQSNEVGMLSDYGYDTARDMSRLATACSFLIALIVAGMSLRFSRKGICAAAIAKCVALVVMVPVGVHMFGTLLINNFGGLGGGL